MNYDIINMFTQQLNIISFKNNISDENIKSMAKLNTSMVHSKEGESNFFIEFNIMGVDNPISLNWIACVILKVNNKEIDKLNENQLLNDETIKKFKIKLARFDNVNRFFI